MSLFSLGLGVGSKNQGGEWLEVFYLQPLLNPDSKIIEIIESCLGTSNGNRALDLNKEQLTQLESALRQQDETELAEITATLAAANRPVVATILSTDDDASSVPEAYLKLHLLSHRLVKPHQVNLSGLFAVLPNVAWTNEGAIDLNELPARQLQARTQGKLLDVDCVDKFPKMTNYVVPTGVRIAHTARVRLGAYIGEGTTIMHEGFVNFNAGTEGPGMIEGRISAGVFVGAGSDLGGRLFHHGYLVRWR